MACAFWEMTAVYLTKNHIVCTAALLVSYPHAGLAGDPPKPGLMRFEKKMLADNLGEGCAIADVNKDGKLDVIAGPAWYEAPTWKAHPFRKLDPTGPNNEYLGTNGDHAMDLNGDGWVDVISGSWFSQNVHWFEHPGKEGLAAGNMWKQHLLSRNFGECEGTLLEDLDDDGVPELVVNRWTPNHPVTAVRIRPGKDGAMPEFKRFDIGEHNGHGMAVGDLNGDGRKDMLVQHGWYEAPEDRWSGKWKYHKAFNLQHVSLPFLVVDVSGDGKNDVIVGQAHDYGLFWLEQGPQHDGEITWTRHDIDRSFSQLHCLVWADLDGDGRPEIITGKRWRAHTEGDPGLSEPVCLFRFVFNPADKAFTRDAISYNDGVGTGMQIRTVDLDGDKRLDIAVAGKTGTYLLLNRGLAGSGQAKK